MSAQPNAIAATRHKRRVPRSFVTSANCIAFPAGNTHTFPNGTTVEAGQTMVFDLDARPKRHDLVLLWRNGGTPFVRCCEIAPVDHPDRVQWVMGVLDTDGDSIVTIDLWEFDHIGVLTGVVHAEVRA